MKLKEFDLLLVSGTTAYISVINIQQYVSIVAGLTAIVSGIFASIYYIKKAKNL